MFLKSWGPPGFKADMQSLSGELLPINRHYRKRAAALSFDNTAALYVSSLILSLCQKLHSLAFISCHRQEYDQAFVTTIIYVLLSFP